jgi:hypothetical protein
MLSLKMATKVKKMMGMVLSKMITMQVLKILIDRPMMTEELPFSYNKILWLAVGLFKMKTMEMKQAAILTEAMMLNQTTQVEGTKMRMVHSRMNMNETSLYL